MEATKKSTGQIIKSWLGNNAIIVLMVLVSIIVGIIHPNFFGPTNIINLLKNVSIRYIIALGISGCLITTGNDLSAGRLAGFRRLPGLHLCPERRRAQQVLSRPAHPAHPRWSLSWSWPSAPWSACATAWSSPTCGCSPSSPPWVCSRWCTVSAWSDTGGTPIGSLNSGFTSIAIDSFLGIPILIWIAVIVAVFFWFLYNKTRHGKYMYAIGGNESAAEVAGVNVAATKIRIYALASCMFGLAGCLLAAKSGGASVNTAQSYELDAIAAATIGGVSTTGGVGTVPGILVGVLVFELMKVALQFMNVNSSYTYIVQGLVIILAVAIDIRKYLAKK